MDEIAKVSEIAKTICRKNNTERFFHYLVHDYHEAKVIKAVCFLHHNRHRSVKQNRGQQPRSVLVQLMNFQLRHQSYSIGKEKLCNNWY